MCCACVVLRNLRRQVTRILKRCSRMRARRDELSARPVSCEVSSVLKVADRVTNRLPEQAADETIVQRWCCGL